MARASFAAVALGALLAGCSAASDSTQSSGILAGPAASLPPTPTQTGTNVSFGGAQDVGFLRDQLQAGLVPSMESLDAPGFFAEHFIELPPPSCGQRLCLQPMVAVMGNLMNGNNCTMLHVGLRSPATADASDRPPLSLALVVDVSGSMEGQKIEYVKSGLELLIDGMHDDDQLALITYSDAANLAVPMSRVGDNRVALRRAVQALRAQGGTNLHDGLITGYEEVQASYDSERQNRVILLSDGNPTAGVTSTPSILMDSRGYNSDGIGLTTVGLGADFNIELMRGLAQQADGNFYFLEDAGAIDEVFQEELSYFVVPIAFDLELRLTAGAEYEFGRALGAPLWHDTAAGGSLSIPSVFVAHRESADDVTEAGGRRGGGSSLLVELMPSDRGESDGNDNGATIAEIELTYRAPGLEPPQTDRIELVYPHKADELLERGYFAGRESAVASDEEGPIEAFDPAAIQKSFVMLNIFVGMESAIIAFHTRSADARTIAELDNLIDAVEDYNDEIGDADIEADLDLLAMLRRNLLAAGIASSAERERARDPWPAD